MRIVARRRVILLSERLSRRPLLFPTTLPRQPRRLTAPHRHHKRPERTSNNPQSQHQARTRPKIRLKIRAHGRPQTQMRMESPHLSIKEKPKAGQPLPKVSTKRRAHSLSLLQERQLLTLVQGLGKREAETAGGLGEHLRLP